MATSSVKFRPPRKLADRETAESLTQWKNEFIVYAQRDQTFAQFLTCNWSQTELNMGFENGPTGSAEEQAENCKLFINHIMTFLGIGTGGSGITASPSQLVDSMI